MMFLILQSAPEEVLYDDVRHSVSEEMSAAFADVHS